MAVLLVDDHERADQPISLMVGRKYLIPVDFTVGVKLFLLVPAGRPLDRPGLVRLFNATAAAALCGDEDFENGLSLVHKVNGRQFNSESVGQLVRIASTHDGIEVFFRVPSNMPLGRVRVAGFLRLTARKAEEADEEFDDRLRLAQI